MIGELTQKQIAEQIAGERAKVESRPKTLDETKRWGSVSKVYSGLNDGEMDMLNQAMLIYANESSLADKKPKDAANATMRLLRKWLIEQIDDSLPSVEKSLVKEIGSEKKAK